MNKKNGRIRYIMALGHFCSDFAQGALAAVLPFLIAAYHYNYTTAAVLVMVSNLVGSIIQPVFGHLADKIDRPHLMTLGIIMSGGGIAVMGLIHNYVGLCIAVVISGIGVAMFHPQGARTVNQYSTDENIGMSLGIFSFGGNAGFTLGPIFASAFVSLFGLGGTLVFFVPAFAFAVAMAVQYRGYTGAPEAGALSAQAETDALSTQAEAGALSPQAETDESVKQDAASGKLRDMPGAFAELCVLVTARSIVFAAMSTFLILYYTDIFGLQETTGSIFLSIFYGIAAIASLAGGKLADTLGHNKCLKISSAILFGSTAAFALSGNVLLSVLVLLPFGIGVSLGYSPMVTLGQKYLPNRVGLASGITLGFSVSIGGIVAPLLGKVGDLYSLTHVFYIVVAIAFVQLVIAFILPRR